MGTTPHLYYATETFAHDNQKTIFVFDHLVVAHRAAHGRSICHLLVDDAKVHQLTPLKAAVGSLTLLIFG
jgi:hypothetical protein